MIKEKLNILEEYPSVSQEQVAEKEKSQTTVIDKYTQDADKIQAKL